MRTSFAAMTLAAVSFLCSPAAVAQDRQVARGIVTEMGGASITIDAAGAAMKFAVDSSTQVEARGASTKTRQLAAGGKQGASLADFLTIGQPVAITYQPGTGTPLASHVRAVPNVGSGAAVTSSEMRSEGTVKSLGADAITIVGSSGGGASFTQTFVIGADTKVVGKGVGTAAAAKGGRAPVSDLIAAGDRVSVTYHKSGNKLQASDVRVTTKGSN